MSPFEVAVTVLGVVAVTLVVVTLLRKAERFIDRHTGGEPMD